jgi:hypothetical protein
VHPALALFLIFTVGPIVAAFMPESVLRRISRENRP